MFFVDKLSHSISLINVQPEENCKIEFGVFWSSGASGALEPLEPLEPLELCSENFKVLNAKKKLAWTDLDKVSFKKIFRVKNAEIEKLAWTGLGKVKKASSVASVFKISSRLVTRGSPKHWPDLDKRCSSCYTLCSCVFADVQSREEVKMLTIKKIPLNYQMQKL
jgi:hypothetical protein